MVNPRTPALLALAALTGSLAACVADGPRADRPPRGNPPQPAGIAATDIDLIAGRFAQDSDKNGYADMIQVTVYLFNAASNYRPAIGVNGSLDFQLTSPDGAPIASWSFDSTAAAAARQPLLAGPGYMFKLSLRDQGRSDEIPSTDAQLRCTFTPAPPSTAAPITTRSPVRVGVGRL